MSQTREPEHWFAQSCKDGIRAVYSFGPWGSRAELNRGLLSFGYSPGDKFTYYKCIGTFPAALHSLSSKPEEGKRRERKKVAPEDQRRPGESMVLQSEELVPFCDRCGCLGDFQIVNTYSAKQQLEDHDWTMKRVYVSGGGLLSFYGRPETQVWCPKCIEEEEPEDDWF